MSHDIEVLQQALMQSTGNSLWCADENVTGFIPAGFRGCITSNRFDIVQQLLPRYKNTHFSDFDLTRFKPGTFDRIFFRIAKEKAINLHIIAESFKQLGHGGKLTLIGHKDEGINSLLAMIEANYKCHVTIEKHKAQLKQLDILSDGQQSTQPAENDYSRIRQLTVGDTVFFSKPGIFGWNKVDAGSALLMRSLRENHSANPEHKVLDLGCGYGYLSIKAKEAGFNTIDATDNNAAAIEACRQNFIHFNIKGDVVADNHAEHQNRKYDLVLCNPPFHKGFGHDKNLTDIFIREAFRLLNQRGEAWFVTNQFIGVEKIASPLFSSTVLVQKEAGFKILQLKKS